MTASLFAELLDRCRFPQGDGPLDCAVSGGADSLALLVLACATGRDVTAFHVDHGLRPDSAKEANAVAGAAARFGARFEGRTTLVEPGPNIEARARKARFDALPPGVLTGHTADDQAETILLNLMRGAGIDGLSGMSIDGHPMLAIRKSETVALCAEVGLIPFQDPTNESKDILRNRVRSELLPLMNDMAGRDVAPVLNRQADNLRHAAEVLDLIASSLDPTDALAVTAAHPALASRAVRGWLRSELDDEHHPPDAGAIARVLDVAAGRSKACDVMNGVRVVRSKQRLTVSKAQ